MSEESLALLRSIDASLKTLVANARPPQGAAPAKNAGAVATDREMSGRFGDPQIRFNPNTWPRDQGDFVGKTMSQCPPEFLTAYAVAKESMGQKADREGTVANNGKPKGDYDRLDARVARGWAQRNQGKTTARPSAPGFDDDTDVSY